MAMAIFFGVGLEKGGEMKMGGEESGDSKIGSQREMREGRVG